VPLNGSDAKAKKQHWRFTGVGYRVICERHNMKQFCSTMAEAKSVQVQHRREGCLEAEIKKPR